MKSVELPTEKLLDGKNVADALLLDLAKKVKKLGCSPVLSIVLCGDDAASKMYVTMKQKRAKEIGVIAEVYEFPADVLESDLLAKIQWLNGHADGIIVQLPLPKHLDVQKVLDSISPDKDVDGLTSFNLGKIARGNELCAPATPKGIIRLLEHYRVAFSGARIVIVNHSPLIGKPLSWMLLNRGATVIVCNEFTRNLSEHTLSADIVVSAVGRAGLIDGSMLSEGVVVVDAGITKVDGKVRGDVEVDSVLEKARFITPVPGGVGPMTIAMLLETLVELKIQQMRER